jgi:phage shock protein A
MTPPNHAELLAAIKVIENKLEAVDQAIVDLRRDAAQMRAQIAELTQLMAAARGGFRVLILVSAVMAFLIGLVTDLFGLLKGD